MHQRAAEALRALWRALRAWMWADRRRPVCSVRSACSDELASDRTVHVPLGSAPRAACGLVLHDAMPPREVARVITFARRRALPIEGWVLWNPSALPRRSDEIAEWIVELSASSAAPLFVAAETTSMAESLRADIARVRRRRRHAGRSRPGRLPPG